jgi:hypothetical protein
VANILGITAAAKKLKTTPPTEGPVAAHRDEVKKEANRVHSQKSRMKRKEYVQDLEQKVRRSVRVGLAG